MTATTGLASTFATRRTPRRPGAWRTLAVAAATILLLSTGYTFARSMKRMLLWHVVQLCAANKQLTGAAFPCIDADLSKGIDGGYVVLKAPLDPEHDIVAVPTVPLSGVESPSLREPDAPNYFAAAWQARRFVEASVPQLARDDIGLAVNARVGRSQDQLHIHIDCVHAGVRDALKANAGLFRTHEWTHLPFLLAGEHYWGLRLNSPDLGNINVFKLVFDGLRVQEADSEKVTIVLAGANFEKTGPGFYALAKVAGPRQYNEGHGEFLLDHACAVANPRAPLPGG